MGGRSINQPTDPRRTKGEKRWGARRGAGLFLRGGGSVVHAGHKVFPSTLPQTSV